MTIRRGEVVFEDGQILTRPGSGRLLRRGRSSGTWPPCPPVDAWAKSRPDAFRRRPHVGRLHGRRDPTATQRQPQREASAKTSWRRC